MKIYGLIHKISLRHLMFTCALSALVGFGASPAFAGSEYETDSKNNSVSSSATTSRVTETTNSDVTDTTQDDSVDGTFTSFKKAGKPKKKK